MKYTVEVVARLDQTYRVEVEAEDEEMALVEARSEAFGVIDPSDITVSAVEVLS